MLKNILMIANPGSGKGNAPKHAETLRQLLIDEYESKITLRETTQVGDAKEWAQAAKSEDFDVVICLGGDGTVNEVINGLMLVENPPLFSFIPIGTANDLGRVLGFDMSPEVAIEQFRQLTEDTIDIGQVNDHYFMDAVAIGDIPEAVMETDSEKKNRLGYLAYVVDGAQAILQNEDKEYRIMNSNNEEFRISSKAIVVALTSSLGGVENLIEHRKYNDGLFQFFALKGNVLTSGVDTLTNQGGIPEERVENDSILAFSDTKVSIQSIGEADEKKGFTNVDGDEGPALPLEIRVHQKALRVLRPHVEEGE